MTVIICRSILALLAAALPAFAQNNLCDKVPQIMRQLADITGMKIHHPVPCAFITKADVNKFLKERVHEVAKPEEIRAEELTLKKFNFVPADFDLAKNTVDLLTEQAAAFYDYNKKKMFITETDSAEPQEPVLAHELGHALADQNYNLAKFIKRGEKSDDGSTARLAVMEGQATWLMSEFLARQNGRSLKSSPSLVESMAKVSDSGGGDYPVFDNEPLYLRVTLVFPYSKGMLFQNAVEEHDGKQSFGEVFKKPPVSTQQILHPEKYFSNVKPSDPKLPDVKLPHSYKPLVGGVLGELEHRILIEQAANAKTADQIAPHWRGSNFALLEDKTAKRVVLFYAAEWDSEDAARQYLAVYRTAMQRKWKKMTVSTNTPDVLTGEGDDGRFELRRSGGLVTSVEGLPAEIN
ncbi:MAG TPA: ImmA/IrrE family metallo-endopeptidase [Bryobacteraceae bacterium]|nr:ImmA/IrrE family metallo-endopeptidase [Bryobacteraceae bacterium]